MADELQIRIAIAQMNPVVGDLSGNAARIIKFYEKAKDKDADLVVFPELCLIGYPPEDLVLMPSFQDRALLALQEIAGKTIGGPGLLVGTLWEEKGKLYNAAVMLENGSILHVERKVNLPNNGIFDEKRIFTSGGSANICEWRGVRLGILICEDVWTPMLPEQLADQDCELTIVLNASPFESDKMSHRRGITNAASKRIKAPLIYVNMVGGQDDIVFDGGSYAVNEDGMLLVQLPYFNEALEVISVKKSQKGCRIEAGVEQRIPGFEESIWNALVLGLHDYVGKNGFEGILIGLSGGIDSAVSAAIAVDALGPEHVKGVLMPSPHSSSHSVEDAKDSALMLGIEAVQVPITHAMEVFESMLTPVLGGRGWMDEVLVGGNLQARLRGLVLMTMSNQSGRMVLTTGNKSEIAVGYTTLYGDAVGGYNALKDVYKTQVYQLANWRNNISHVIPQNSIDKAPSAELAPGQKDADQLPAYDILDSILIRFLEQRMSAEDIVAEGFDMELVNRVLKMVRMAEYKRRQSCPGTKVSPMMFGRDRRYPITNKF